MVWVRVMLVVLVRNWVTVRTIEPVTPVDEAVNVTFGLWWSSTVPTLELQKYPMFGRFVLTTPAVSTVCTARLSTVPVLTNRLVGSPVMLPSWSATGIVGSVGRVPVPGKVGAVPWPEARCDHSGASSTAKRETIPAKAIEMIHRFGTTEPRMASSWAVRDGLTA
jgi:hypothetical protein